MKILHVDTGDGWRGGQQQVFWLMEGARERGLEQFLLAPAGSPLARRMAQHGMEVAELVARIRSRENARIVREKARQFDLLHAHDSHAHTLAFAARLFDLRNKPPLVVSRRVGFPIGFLGRMKYRSPALYIAVSEHVRRRLLDAGVPAEKIRVVYDGVPPPAAPDPALRAEFRLRHGLNDQAFLLGMLTSLAPEKLLDEELDVLAELPPTAHLWLGVPAAEPDRGAAGAALLQRARRLGLERRFQIIPVAEDAGGFLASLDLFLYLSQSEGLGSAILLAMAHSLPVVASDAGGIPEIVRQHETGLLVSGEPTKELPPAIRLLMGSPDLRKRFATAGHRFVLANATNDRMVAQTITLYDELLQGSRRSRA